MSAKLSRTLEVCPDEGKAVLANAVLAYAGLSAGAIALAEAPGALQSKQSRRCAALNA